jgi:hypothetical protein
MAVFPCSRFIPQRDPNLTRDFQLMDPASSRSTRASTDLTEQEAANGNFFSQSSGEQLNSLISYIRRFGSKADVFFLSLRSFE